MNNIFMAKQKGHSLEEHSIPLQMHIISLGYNSDSPSAAELHKKLEFVYVFEGGVDACIGGQTLQLLKGQGAFINRNQSHFFSAHEKSTLLSISFSEDILYSCCGSSQGYKYVLPITNAKDLRFLKISPKTPQECSLLDELRRLAQTYGDESLGVEFSVCAHLLFIWRFFLLVLKETNHMNYSSFDTQLVSEEQIRLNAIVSYIKDHYNERITLQELANAAFISKTECCRFFKRCVLSTPFEFINNYRLNMSIDLLRETDLSIGDIASYIGFGSASYYSDSFKKIFGCSPSSFRKQWICQ